MQQYAGIYLLQSHSTFLLILLKYNQLIAEMYNSKILFTH